MYKILFFLSFSIFAQDKIELAYQLEQSYYSIALKLAQNYDQNGPCGGQTGVEAYSEDIVNALSKAKFYFDYNELWNSATNRKFKVDTVFYKNFKTNFNFKKGLGIINFENSKKFSNSLAGVIFYGPAQGAYGNTTYIEFINSNFLTIATLDISDMTNFEFKWIKKSYSYEMSKIDMNNYALTFKNADEEIEYMIKRKFYEDDFYIIPKSLEKDGNPHFDGFVIYEDECSA